MTGNGSQPELLNELWLRMRRVLAPFGIRVDSEHLALWRDQIAHGYGPLRAAERGDPRVVEDLIALLRMLTNTGKLNLAIEPQTVVQFCRAPVAWFTFSMNFAGEYSAGPVSA